MVELAAFQLWLHCLFFWLLRDLVFWLSDTDPSSNCTAAPLGHPLQMHHFSGYLITKTLLSHCLNSSLLSDLATSVLALVQLPSSSNFCLSQLSKAPFFRWLKWHIFSTNHLIGVKCPCLHTLIVSAAGLSSLAHLKLCTLRALKWKETSLLLMGFAFLSRANSSGWPTASFSNLPTHLHYWFSDIWIWFNWYMFEKLNISCQAWKGKQWSNELQGYRNRIWEDRLITYVD